MTRASTVGFLAWLEMTRRNTRGVPEHLKNKHSRLIRNVELEELTEAIQPNRERDNADEA